MNRNYLTNHQKLNCTSRLVLRYKALTKKDLLESIKLTWQFALMLNRFLIARSSNMRDASIFKKLNFNFKNLWILHGSVQHKCAFAQLAYALSKAHNHSRKIKQSKKLFTVIRSPFVFKKTREQFTLEKHVCAIVLTLNKNEIALMLELFSQLRLPGELALNITN